MSWFPCCGDASNVLDDSLYTAWLDLELEKEELGHGQYGTVHRATNKLTRGHFAVKVCHKAKIASKAEELALLNEVDILRRLNHPNIIRFYDMHDTEADFFIVTELVSGGELFDRIIEREHYSEKEARDCARVLLEAISYLHHHSIAHRDIKPENLLLASKTNDHEIKLADFGFAAECRGRTLHEPCGTPNYVAPELLRNEFYGMEVDMWSCGVMIFILLGGYMPFDESDGGQRKMYDRIKAGQYEFDPAVFGAVSKAATSLIKGLIVVDWQKRLSARAALEHPWFTQHQPHALSETKLALSQTQMKKWRARKRLRAAQDVVLASTRMRRLTGGGT